MIPRVTIYQEDQLERKVYVFWLDEYTMTLVLDQYREESKATPRHKWKVDRAYNRLDRRNSTLTRNQIVLSDDVRKAAYDEFVNQITVDY